KAESARIFEAVKTDPVQAQTNLRFLIETGLVSDRKTRDQIQDYFAKRPPGQGPSLPSVGQAKSPLTADRAVARYDHVILIIAENQAYGQIIGNPGAFNLNRLASNYGLASNYYGVVHPSKANYIAMIAGDTLGIHDDDAYYCLEASADPYCPSATRVKP